MLSFFGKEGTSQGYGFCQGEQAVLNQWKIVSILYVVLQQSWQKNMVSVMKRNVDLDK